MTDYHGDIDPGDTIYWLFPSKVNGIATNLAGSPALVVYKNSISESALGVTLTAPYDGVVGQNQVLIDTSASGSFYAAGNNFDVVFSAGTVGGVSVVGDSVGGFSIQKRSPLRPTTAARTLDVSATGGAGIDWANVEAPTTVLALTGTTISTAQVVASVTGAVGSVTGAVGSVTGNVGGNVVGSVASVTGAVGSVTGLNAALIDVATSTRLAPTVAARTLDVTATGAAGIDWGNLEGQATGVTLSNTIIQNVVTVTGSVASVTGNIGGIAGVTIPSTIASPTNITGGTITTVGTTTNLTNAPTNGDFTAAMKTSLNAATPASITGAVGSVTGSIGGNVNGNLVGNVNGNVVGSVASVTGNVGGNVTGSVGSVVGLNSSLLDVAVSTRLASVSYTAPDNAGIGFIAALTNTTLDATMTSRAPASTALSSVQWTNGRAAKLDDIGNVLQINGSTQGAMNLAKTTAAIARGTVAAGATTTSLPTSVFSLAVGSVNQFEGRTVLFTDDTTTAGLAGTSSVIVASTNSATPTLTVAALSATPVAGDTFTVV